MLLSFLCPLTDMMCRAFKSTSVEYKLWSSLWLNDFCMLLRTPLGVRWLSSSCRDDFGRWKWYSFIALKTLKYFSKDDTGQKGLIVCYHHSSFFSLNIVWLFVSSSVVSTTQRFPCELNFLSKSVFLSWRRFCRPPRQKNNIILKKTLFCRVVGFSVLKTPHRYNFFMSCQQLYSFR